MRRFKLLVMYSVHNLVTLVSLIDTNIFLSILLSGAFSLCPSLRAKRTTCYIVHLLLIEMLLISDTKY
jgi:hypothetical protein